MVFKKKNIKTFTNKAPYIKALQITGQCLLLITENNFVLADVRNSGTPSKQIKTNSYKLSFGFITVNELLIGFAVHFLNAVNL